MINAWTEMPQHWPDSLSGRPAVIEVVADAPSAPSVAESISVCERRFGARGRAGRIAGEAHEFGDHPRGQLSGCAAVLARAITAPGPQRLTRGSNHRHLRAKESFDALRITRS